MKPKAHWIFTSTTSVFDGPRLVKEALAEGLEIITITRGKENLTLCTWAYLRRCERAGLRLHGPMSPGDWYYPTVAPGLSRERDPNANAAGYAVQVREAGPLPSVDASTIHEELLRREKEKKRTSVYGY
jgi:hypothetical protein